MCLLTALLFVFLITSSKYFVSPFTANKSRVTLTPVHGVLHSRGISFRESGTYGILQVGVTLSSANMPHQQHARPVHLM